MISNARSWAGGTEEPIFSTARSATSIRAARPRSAVLTSSCSSLEPRNMSYPIRITIRPAPGPACAIGGEPTSADIASLGLCAPIPPAIAAAPGSRSGSDRPGHLRRPFRDRLLAGVPHPLECLGGGTTRARAAYTIGWSTLADGKCFPIQCRAVENSAEFAEQVFAEQVEALQAATRVLAGVALRSLDVLDGVITLPQFRLLAVLAGLGTARSARGARALRLGA